MRVHFASGVHPFPKPWVNVDFGPQHGADYTADLLDELPLQVHDVTHAYVGHFLEHITVSDGVDFLRRVNERMAPGGRLYIVGPDTERGDAYCRAGAITAEFRRQIGKHENTSGPGMSHLWDCTPGEVLRQCRAAGWRHIVERPIQDLPVHDVPVISLAGWQFFVTATT